MDENFQNDFNRRNSGNQYAIDNHQKDFTDLNSCKEVDNIHRNSSRSSSSNFFYDDNEYDTISNAPLVRQDDIESNENNIIQTYTIDNRPFQPYSIKTFDDLLSLINEDPYKFIFAAIPKQNQNYIQCRLIRDSSTLFETFHLDVELENNTGAVPLLFAEKETKIFGESGYKISLASNFQLNLCSAKLVCGNSTGTNYSLYLFNSQQRQELASIRYETNFLGFKGPRKIEILLPKFDNEMRPLFEENDIHEYSCNEANDSIIHLRNKPPTWEGSGYVLKFDGDDRVVVPSLKNFQIILKDDQNVKHCLMQFGRTSDDVFSCDFRYPFSFAQVFAIGLSSLETRIFRE